MKTLLLTSLVAAAVSSGFSQGAIDVGNNFGATVFRAPIYGLEMPDIAVRKVGQPGSPAFPTGTTVYTGPRLLGTGYSFGFYASTTGITTDASSLSLIGVLPFGTTAGTAGFVTTATMNVPGVPAGSPTTWQIRVWDNSYGPNFDFSDIRGVSQLVNSGPLGGVSPSGPVLNPSTSSGWTSFNVYWVPEPSVFALAGLGAVVMLLIRRR
jgi:hypothetical protein